MKWFKHLVFLVFFVMFEFDTLNKVVPLYLVYQTQTLQKTPRKLSV